MYRLLRLSNAILSTAISIILIIVAVYACYCLWDNNQIYMEAENVQEELLQFKPTKAPNFSEILKINKDVCAWLTLDSTEIDHPVLQGNTNFDYINTDVYGNFALAGSIFLDAGNDKGFSEPYSVLYGHHMDNRRMFGDLDLYKDEAFFKQSHTGTLILPEISYSLEPVACMLVPASEKRIFSTSIWDNGLNGLVDFIEAEAIHIAPDILAELKARINAGEEPQVLALTTCSAEFTDARTIVLVLMNNNTREDREDDK